MKEMSKYLSMEFATDTDAYEWAVANGYRVDKIQQSDHGNISCICWMSRVQ